ncbi:MAG: putative endopeptidase [Chlamydiales bacterium]|jgi:putative endopeptidase
MRSDRTASYAVLLLLACTPACKVGTGHTPLVVGDLEPWDMDLSVDPGTDFYRHANGGWLDKAEIPPERSSWSVSAEINETNRDLLLEILEEAASSNDALPGSLVRKLGDFWGTGMDMETIDALGATPLEPILARIEAIHNGASFAQVIASLHAIGVGVLFGPGAEAGLQDPTTMMAWVTQGGLGLPDRDYYLRDDEDTRQQREQYVAHVAAMLQLLGDSEEAAGAGARAVMHIETRLASKSLTNVELTNPQNWDRTVPTADVIAAMPNFDWTTYLSAIGVQVEVMNQPMPEFFSELDTLLAEVSLADWMTYLRWHLASGMSGALSSDFERENFHFFTTVLAGVPEMEPRWKRVLGQTSSALGEALGQLFVRRAFTPEAKERAGEMVQELLTVMHDRLERVEWMGSETRAQALTKLAGFGVKIGYPDKWRDYSTLHVGSDSYAHNVMRAREHEFRWQLSRVGNPVDPSEWGMTPQTLNAYYHPLRNEIVFPAAILQPPLFSDKLDDPLNYGAMGAIIGHEITHGFDDSGSQFDAQGRLRNWWTDSDRTEFESRTKKLVEQYSAIEVLPDVFVNGELTLGENIADLGGLSIALEAMQRANADVPDPMLGGFTREQRFFLAFERVWRSKIRDEALKLQVNTDVHSPSAARAACPLANMQQFADAFNLPADARSLLPVSARAEIW